MKKKLLTVVLAMAMVASIAACGAKKEEAPKESEKQTEAAPQETQKEEPKETEAAPEAPAVENRADVEKGEGVMTYAQYCEAAVDDKVVIECYVQDHQSWWDNKITVYAADAEGAYFLYNMACSEEDAAKLVPGTKIKVTGYKAEWSGEVEVAEGATFEIEEGCYIAAPVDVTPALGTDELIDFQNQYVEFKGLTVAAKKNADGAEVAYLYKWDGSGEDGDDLYFDVTDGTNTYTFTVESYLRGKETEVYQAVKNLQVGQTIDMEGFLYWYEGANPHITVVK